MSAHLSNAALCVMQLVHDRLVRSDMSPGRTLPDLPVEIWRTIFEYAAAEAALLLSADPGVLRPAIPFAELSLDYLTAPTPQPYHTYHPPPQTKRAADATIRRINPDLRLQHVV